MQRNRVCDAIWSYGRREKRDNYDGTVILSSVEQLP